MRRNSKIQIGIKILLLLGFSFAKAQVGIGIASPNASAMLDISSGNKGLLIPRVALNSLTDNTTVPSPATGLLIWNSGSGSLTAQGFYFWNNSQWNLLSPATATPLSSNGWNTAGTNAGNYGGSGTNISIGTSTYDDLVFKVNSSTVGRLGANNSIGLGNNVTVAQNAVAIGTTSNAAYQTIAIGNNAKTASNDATAVGNNASANGYQSIALGYNAKTISNNETALGMNSQTNNQNSTAIGSGANATGQNSTAIGYNASTSQYNAIVLGDNNASVGIGTSTPNNTTKLDVNGQYKLGDRGTVNKNQISFEVWPSVSINNLPSGKSTTMNIVIPPALALSTTRATITVTPAGDFAGNATFSISNPRMTSASNITINLTNISGSAESLTSSHFYVTVNEF